jgi:hypothetical protein
MDPPDSTPATMSRSAGCVEMRKSRRRLAAEREGYGIARCDPDRPTCRCRRTRDGGDVGDTSRKPVADPGASSVVGGHSDICIAHVRVSTHGPTFRRGRTRYGVELESSGWHGVVVPDIAFGGRGRRSAGRTARVDAPLLSNPNSHTRWRVRGAVSSAGMTAASTSRLRRSSWPCSHPRSSRSPKCSYTRSHRSRQIGSRVPGPSMWCRRRPWRTRCCPPSGRSCCLPRPSSPRRSGRRCHAGSPTRCSSVPSTLHRRRWSTRRIPPPQTRNPRQSSLPCSGTRCPGGRGRSRGGSRSSTSSLRRRSPPRHP